MNHARVFKKTAPNGKLTVYVEKRELAIRESGIEPLHGVLFVDSSYLKDRKVFGQFILTFRYGREDEEVMGLRFCNEACLQAELLWPREDGETSPLQLTPLQDTLAKRLGAGAVPFNFSVTSLAPPSVTLLPARTYSGAPIGTNYNLRIFVGDNVEDKPHKRSSIRMGVKLYQLSLTPTSQSTPPFATLSKQFLLTEGQVALEASLNKGVYERNDNVVVNVTITNTSSRNVKRVKIIIVQFVDVAMFSNGKFKNVVASIDCNEGCPVCPGVYYSRSFNLSPTRGTIKNWIALEEFYDKESVLSSTVLIPENGERNIFAIYVSYYVKVKAITSAIGGEVSVKIPFHLMRVAESSPPEDKEREEKTTTAPEAMTTEKPPKSINGQVITTSQSMFELNSSASKQYAEKIRRKPPSRSASEDAGRILGENKRSCSYPLGAAINVDQGQLVNSLC